MLGRVDQHVLGQHRAMDHPGPVRGADRDQQAPPHPRRIPRIDARRERGAYFGEAAESGEPADQVGTPFDARTRIVLPLRLHELWKVGREDLAE